MNGCWRGICEVPNGHPPLAVAGPGPMAAVHPSVYYDGFHDAYPKWQNGGYSSDRQAFVWDSRKGTQKSTLIFQAESSLAWLTLTALVCSISIQAEYLVCVDACPLGNLDRQSTIRLAAQSRPSCNPARDCISRPPAHATGRVASHCGIQSPTLQCPCTSARCPKASAKHPTRAHWTCTPST